MKKQARRPKYRLIADDASVTGRDFGLYRWHDLYGQWGYLGTLKIDRRTANRIVRLLNSPPMLFLGQSRTP